MNKQTAHMISNDVREALKVIEEKHGVTLDLRPGTYDKYGLTMTLAFTSNDLAKEKFERSAEFMNINPKAFGKTFVRDSRKYVVVGINTRARKYPLEVKEISTGKEFGFMWNEALENLILNS